MKQKSSLRRVIGIICILLVLAFTIYLSVIMVGRINQVVLKDSYIRIFKTELVICAGFLILSFDILFGFFTAMKNKILKAIGWFLRCALVLSMGFVIILGLKTCIGGFIKPTETSNNAVVLGLALQNGQHVPDLIDRVETAAQFSQENPEATLILTGGNPDKNGMTEAAVMRDLLIERGVSEDRIILEDRAKTTIENFRNTAQMVDPTQPIVLITSNYHMERSVKTANDAGFTNVLRRPAPSSFFEYGANVMWEIIHTLNSYKSYIVSSI